MNAVVQTFAEDIHIKIALAYIIQVCFLNLHFATNHAKV